MKFFIVSFSFWFSPCFLLPVINPDLSQTGIGWFRLVGFNNLEVFRVSSKWLQDSVTKKLKITVGEIGEPGWQAQFWFFPSKGYELTTDAKGNLVCTQFDDFGYDEEIQAYNSYRLSYLGTHKLKERNNTEVDVFAGQVLDGVGPLNVICYGGLNTSYFLGMTTIGGYGKFAFNEYWYGDNYTPTAPKDSEFQLHPVCQMNATKVHFADKFDLTTGQLKVPQISVKDTCHCGQVEKAEMISKPSLFLYSVLCCPILDKISG